MGNNIFYVVDNGNAQVNNRTELKETVCMINVTYFSYLYYVH